MIRLTKAVQMAVVGVLAAASVAVAGPAVSATIPPASVNISALAHQGPHNTILASMHARCASGFTFRELSFEFVQGTLDTTGTVSTPVPCDGVFHTVKVQSLEGYRPGTAHMNARFTVVNSATGATRQALASKDICVRPAAQLVIGTVGYLKPNGGAVIRVKATCDRPWVEPDLTIDVSQGGVSAQGTGAGLGLVCDGAWHLLRVPATPSTGRFVHGAVSVNGFLTVFDPQSFDPVAQAQASGSPVI